MAEQELGVSYAGEAGDMVTECVAHEVGDGPALRLRRVCPHAEQDDQAHLETKIKRLRERMKKAVVVETDREGPTLSFGRTAEVLDEASGTVHTWTIVGATEADLAKGMLSAESPVADALLGCSPGEAVDVDTPGGPRKYRVQKLL